jgi:hypothetical protein
MNFSERASAAAKDESTMSDTTLSPAPVPRESHDAARKPPVEIYINTAIHSNAHVVKVEIIGEDADARALVEKAVRMALSSVLEPCDPNKPIPGDGRPA